MKRGKGAKAAAKPKVARKGAQEPASAPQAGTRRPGTKQAQLIAMLEQDEGASVAEIMAATGWLAHRVRGAMAGALKKRLGLEVTSEVEEERGRVYRIR